MSEFKVGEIAIVCNLIQDAYLNGMEVEIIEDLRERYAPKRNKNYLGYKVKTLSGETGGIEPNNLKKKRPKQDTCSWDECEWAPTKAPVEA